MNPEFLGDQFIPLLLEYRELYGPGTILFLEPGGELVLLASEEDEKGYFVPVSETVAGFAEKLARSRESGKNQFFEAYRDCLRDVYPDNEAMY